MTKGSLRIHPGTAHVTFHPALFPQQFETREQLAGAVRAGIACRFAGMDARRRYCLMMAL